MTIERGAAKPLPVPARVKSLIGRRFGRLKVKAYGGSARGGRTQWCCECDCGAYCMVPGRRLLAQDKHRQVSCGCARRDPEVRWRARMKVPAKRRAAICGICQPDGHRVHHGEPAGRGGAAVR